MQHGYSEPNIFIEKEEPLTSKRSLVALIALAVILVIGAVCAARLNELPPTYNGDVDVAALAQDPTAYNLDNADGAAYVMVSENLDKTAAQNVCFSVVFNFRGYDTMGESFILIAALSGSLCILRPAKRLKKRKEVKKNG